MQLAWGNKVSLDFCNKVVWIGQQMTLDPSDLMACMAFESNRTFSPSVLDKVSGAIGLIQFMPATAKALGTSTQALGAMTAESQLHYVYEYFAPKKGQLHNLGDIYMTILWPAAIGKPDDFVLWTKTGQYAKQYSENHGLDRGKKGYVTRADAWSGPKERLAEGMKPGYFRDFTPAPNG